MLDPSQVIGDLRVNSGNVRFGTTDAEACDADKVNASSGWILPVERTSGIALTGIFAFAVSAEHVVGNLAADGLVLATSLGG